jgi:hypothetical protein
MYTGRRLFLSTIVMTLAGGTTLFAKQMGQRPPQLPGVPRDGGADASWPGSPRNEPPPRKRNPKQLLEENKKNLRRDVDHLFELSQQLKDEADKTEEMNVLSLSLIHKTEEIEKLARKIRDAAKAA